MAYSSRNFLTSCGYGSGGLILPDGSRSSPEREGKENIEDPSPAFQNLEDVLFNDSKEEARKLFVSNYKRSDFDPPDENDDAFAGLKNRFSAVLGNLWADIG